MLEESRRLAEAGRLEEAWTICNKHLTANPESGPALVLASFIFEKMGCAGLSYNLAKRVISLYPQESAGYTNLGRCADVMWRMDEALDAYDKAIMWSKTDQAKTSVLINQSAVHVQMGRFEKARRYAARALEIDPTARKAQHNMGICLLAERKWAEGWPLYRGSLGSGNRIRWQYNDEADWAGEPGKVVVISGEQGLGDEICAAAMYDEAIAISKRVILDCDARLKNLFQRSFPKAKVYGTRNQKALDWDEEDRMPDASMAGMQLGEFFRTKPEHFTGKPYLKPCPDRLSMWRSLWKGKGKPAIGVAWTGGIDSTGAAFRKWALEDMKPLFDAVDAHWVCLQYKDAAKEIKGTPVVQYPYATLTSDYDDTAALVASLSGVVAMDTSVIHLAGALGVPCAVGVPKIANWRWGEKWTDQPWYSSCQLFRQGDAWPWGKIIEKAKTYAAQ
jgi:tetratricopeptide (TPR) repeat protein